MTRKEKPVYYDMNTVSFTELREITESGDLIFGGDCDYYSDAKTTIAERNHKLSDEYVAKYLIPVNYVNRFAQYNGNGWKRFGLDLIRRKHKVWLDERGM